MTYMHLPGARGTAAVKEEGLKLQRLVCLTVTSALVPPGSFYRPLVSKIYCLVHTHTHDCMGHCNRILSYQILSYYRMNAETWLYRFN